MANRGAYLVWPAGSVIGRRCHLESGDCRQEPAGRVDERRTGHRATEHRGGTRRAHDEEQRAEADSSLTRKSTCGRRRGTAPGHRRTRASRSAVCTHQSGYDRTASMRGSVLREARLPSVRSCHGVLRDAALRVREGTEARLEDVQSCRATGSAGHHVSPIRCWAWRGQVPKPRRAGAERSGAT